MPVLFLIALLASAPASVPPQPTDRTPLNDKCPEARNWFAGQAVGAEARRLDQLPPGRLELTVLREVDGCPIPAVLREGISGWPAEQAERAAAPAPAPDSAPRQPR